jgi:hypothetical protein
MEEPGSDGRRDFWTTFNVLQEGLTNSTIHRLEGPGRGRAIQPIRSVVGSTGYNQTLWATAEAFFNEAVAGLTKKERAAFEALRAERRSAASKPLRRQLRVPTLAPAA